jgi:hypothetical protein
MPITPEQCEEWAKLPPSTLPAFTIDLVKQAVQDAPRLRTRPFKVYVQGSYANRTNIDANCDVDLVVQLGMPFEEDVNLLDGDERKLFYQHFGYDEYGWEEFRADLLATFRRSYFVREGKRCLTLQDWDSLVRVPADILPAIEYRRYTTFPNPTGADYQEGVFFRADGTQPVVNYPLEHLKNGNKKNDATRGRFKQVVRVAKNARRDKTSGLEPGTAPSYFVECLLFNVDDSHYRGDSIYQSYRRVVRTLSKLPNLRSLLCQNQIVPMFGDHADAWAAEKAEQVIEALNCQLGPASPRR